MPTVQNSTNQVHSQFQRLEKYRSTILSAGEEGGVKVQGDTFVVTKPLQVYGSKSQPLEEDKLVNFNEHPWMGFPNPMGFPSYAGPNDGNFHKTYISPGTVIHQEPTAGDKVLVQHDTVKNWEHQDDNCRVHSETVNREVFQEGTEHHWFSADRPILMYQGLSLHEGDLSPKGDQVVVFDRATKQPKANQSSSIDWDQELGYGRELKNDGTVPERVIFGIDYSPKAE